MSLKNIRPVVTVMIGACLAPSSHAASIVGNPTFVNSLTGSIINTTAMTNLNQWGYLDVGILNPFAAGTYAFSALAGANYDATPASGTVSITNSTVGNGNTTPTLSHAWTYSGGNNPTSGTDSSIGRTFGSLGATETNGIVFNFNNVGIGSHTITLYLGHILDASQTDTRVFKMKHALSATDGGFSGDFTTNDLGIQANGTTIFSTYQIAFNNAVDTNADLVLTLDSVSGGTGNGMISGYTWQTAAIPEPRATLLGVIGLLLLLRRRRCH